MTVISLSNKSSFPVRFESYMAVRRHFSYFAEQKEEIMRTHKKQNIFTNLHKC